MGSHQDHILEQKTEFEDNFKNYLSNDPAFVEKLITENVSPKTLQTLIEKGSRKRVTIKPATTKSAVLDSKYSTLNIDELQNYLLNESQLELQLCRHFHSSHTLLQDAGKLIMTALVADNVTLYMAKSDSPEDLRKDKAWVHQDNRKNLDRDINDIVKLVAATRTSVFIPHLNTDMRFKGSEYQKSYKSVICIPVLSPNRTLFGVVEMTRNQKSHPFLDSDFQVANSIIGLTCITLHQTVEIKHLTAQRDLNNFLVLVNKKMFNEVRNFDELLSYIVTYTKTLVSAQCCHVFMPDEHGDLYAELFDEQERDESGNLVYSRKRYDIKIPRKKGIIGYVADSHESVNVKNARDDPRFFPDIDKISNYVTRSVLAVPIVQEDDVVGVVEATNKTFGDGFSDKDEETLKKFAMHFSLAANFLKAQEKTRRRKSEASVAREQFLYNMNSHHVSQCLEVTPLPPTEVPAGFNDYRFYTTEHIKLLPQLFMYMALKRFKETPFNIPVLSSFILAVRKNYREVPYHNWEHGFQVTHCMFWLLERIQGSFISNLEAMGYLFACLSHDVDHRGYNNDFMKKMEHPLAVLYSSSVMEQHHYQTTLLILRTNDVFKFLNKADYHYILEAIRNAILATDVATYFPNRQRLQSLLDERKLDMKNEEHRQMVKNLLITGCDFIASCKDWPDQIDTVKKLYEEFYTQGDIEREMGFVPLPFMDRCLKDDLASQQHQFLKYVCVPLFKMIAEIFPFCKPLEEAVNANLDRWHRVKNGEDVPPWNKEILNDIGKDRRWVVPITMVSDHVQPCSSGSGHPV